MPNEIRSFNRVNNEIVLYQPDNTIRLEVQLHDESVWLSQQQMAQLFNVKVLAISKHIKNIYEEGELLRNPTISILETVRMEGKRKVTRNVEYYNLDVIISVGYRIKSQVGTRFRQWATQVLRSHLLQGYSVNRQLIALQQHVDDRLIRIEDRLQKHEEQVAFLVHTHQQPMEELFATGCLILDRQSLIVRYRTYSFYIWRKISSS